MKKLLSILTISTLTASTPAPLLANTALTRVKGDVEITKKNITNGFNIKTSDLTNYWKIVLPENKPFSKFDNKWYFVYNDVKCISRSVFVETKASVNWKKIATDSQFATAVAEWFKTNGKLSSKDPLTAEQVIEQLKKQIPSSITIDGVNTSNYDTSKVSFELDQSEFKPNDKVNITVKYNNEKSSQFTLQIKDSKVPDNSGGDSKLWIIGVVAGVLAFVGISYLLFKRFVFDKYIYPKIINRRHHKIVEQVRKEEAEKDKENNGGQE